MKNILLTLVIALISVPLFAQVSIKERQSLLDFYSSTNGENWNNSWDLNKPAGEWYGITVKENKVISIDLLFNNLDGSIPSTIDQLEHLQDLKLSFNKISGTIPTELGNLKDLKIIELNGNDLNGTIPESLGNLTNLSHLHLSSNKLSGELPESIAELENLVVLNVFDNTLSGIIPIQLAYSNNLRQLMVAENNFEATTSEFSSIIFSNGASVNLENPFTIPKEKQILATESEEEN